MYLPVMSPCDRKFNIMGNCFVLIRSDRYRVPKTQKNRHLNSFFPTFVVLYYEEVKGLTKS